MPCSLAKSARRGNRAAPVSRQERQSPKMERHRVNGASRFLPLLLWRRGLGRGGRAFVCFPTVHWQSTSPFGHRALSALLVAATFWLNAQVRAETLRADVCIYGGTAAGVAAAVQSARLGKTAVIAEPGHHLGGMTSGGLGATDIGNKRAIGGIAREFYHHVAQHYSKEDAWVGERP